MYFLLPHIRGYILSSFLSFWLIKKILMSELRCFQPDPSIIMFLTDVLSNGFNSY